jgi:hypothetical protein
LVTFSVSFGVDFFRPFFWLWKIYSRRILSFIQDIKNPI